MTDELLRKIQNMVGRRIVKEMQVVYLLVELRKLMDREDHKDPVLRMFCNWIVHTALDNRADGSTLILGEFDDFIASLREGQKRTSSPAHLSFGEFRLALIRLFDRFGLSAKFVTNSSDWKTFVKRYSAIVSECPIVFTASRRPLRHIKQIELRGVANGVVVKEWPILQWRLTFQDGTTMDWGFHME
jgi:hypothetical protein